MNNRLNNRLTDWQKIAIAAIAAIAAGFFLGVLAIGGPDVFAFTVVIIALCAWWAIP